ncbi:hypothetical protein [Andreprevotia chitinilytica]|uniref:hypothetical protein n=1 Tax=Andreprevotia chitinilytica TaxID=396808 RepID=UPI0012EBEBD6|nr:hypothetical protein [Andreprevotia chitinilytica]
MRKKILMAVLLAGSSAAYADYSGTISGVVCYTFTNICQIKTSTTYTGAACSTQAAWPLTFDGTTSTGKNILATLLAAQASQRSVVIGGLGTCNLAAGSEDVRHVYISP